MSRDEKSVCGPHVGGAGPCTPLLHAGVPWGCPRHALGDRSCLIRPLSDLPGDALPGRPVGGSVLQPGGKAQVGGAQRGCYASTCFGRAHPHASTPAVHTQASNAREPIESVHYKIASVRMMNYGNLEMLIGS